MSGRIHVSTEMKDKIYNYLLERGEWVKLGELAADLGFVGFGENFHNTTARLQITTAISEINLDERYEKIVVHGRRGLKISTKDEAEHFVNARCMEAYKMLAKTKVLAKKAGLDNQLDFSGKTISAFNA